MAVWCKAYVCGCSLAGVADSNPAGSMDILCLVNAVCCQVEASAMGRSLVLRTPTECGVSNCL